MNNNHSAEINALRREAQKQKLDVLAQTDTDYYKWFNQNYNPNNDMSTGDLYEGLNNADFRSKYQTKVLSDEFYSNLAGKRSRSSSALNSSTSDLVSPSDALAVMGAGFMTPEVLQPKNKARLTLG